MPQSGFELPPQPPKGWDFSPVQFLLKGLSDIAENIFNCLYSFVRIMGAGSEACMGHSKCGESGDDLQEPFLSFCHG